MSDPRIAVIGCGHWGKNLVRNFYELGNLAAICDVSTELAKTFSKKYEVPARTLDELLADDDLDAVAIAAPAVQHAAIARRVLESGKHAFVEKPIALDLNEADELCQLAAARKRVLMVGHLLRYHAAFQKLQSLAQAGELGRIQYVYSNRLNLGRFRTEENSLWSFAPHDISMILALLGDRLESVYATGEAYLHKHLADVTTTHLSFESGQAAHIHVSWLHPFKEQRLVVVGDNAMAVFDDGKEWADKLTLYRHQITWNAGVPSPARGTGEPVELEESEPLRAECAHFIECVATGATPETDGREGLRVLRVLDAAQRSMETGNVIRFHAENRAYFAHETAVIDSGAEIGAGTKIWHFSHVLSGSKVGEGCNIGQNVVIGPDVSLGNGCKIQNNVSIYKGVTLEDHVFCGPSMVFTNVTTPRSEVNRKKEYAETLVKRGATIGANATIVCPVTLNEYSFVGAGAVVTKDVPAHALVVGNPAKVVGYACQCGETLEKGDWKQATCSRCGTDYTRGKKGVRRAGATKPKKKKRKKA